MKKQLGVDPLLDAIVFYQLYNDKESIEEQYKNICALVETVPDINRRDEKGNTYLMVAAVNYKDDIVRLLLLNGADPNIGDHTGVRPLAYLFLKEKQGREDIMKLLLQYGADPSRQDKPGQNAFDFAKICGAESHLVTLLEEANMKLHGVLQGNALGSDSKK